MIDSILVSLIFPDSNMEDITEEIEEMKLLAQTIDYDITHIETQKRLSVDPSTYIGKGKLKEILDKISLLNKMTLAHSNMASILRSVKV